MRAAAEPSTATQARPVAPPPRVVLLSGNTRRPSRSRTLASHIGERLVATHDVRLQQLDLCDAGRELGTAYARNELSPSAEGVVAAIEQADALVVTVPVHNGSYPGLFKHLVDFIEPRALAGKPVLLGATGGAPRHALMVDYQLRPLFAYFSAQVAAYSIYLVGDDLGDYSRDDSVAFRRVERAVADFVHLVPSTGAAA